MDCGRLSGPQRPQRCGCGKVARSASDILARERFNGSRCRSTGEGRSAPPPIVLRSHRSQPAHHARLNDSRRHGNRPNRGIFETAGVCHNCRPAYLILCCNGLCGKHPAPAPYLSTLQHIFRERWRGNVHTMVGRFRLNVAELGRNFCEFGQSRKVSELRRTHPMAILSLSYPPQAPAAHLPFKMWSRQSGDCAHLGLVGGEREGPT